ncbi:hypothetical protein [Kribbella soli]|uniref:Uncharacterized protein n=1 Tax=Kribbella soli TaxID=1124743 RepID=A0A4R0H5J4_9ACTN|nr:hypothetical protein [Kribbella soli]TCC03722.1 hypothetical protein E0H45_31865 [Kribbella soli]
MKSYLRRASTAAMAVVLLGTLATIAPGTAAAGRLLYAVGHANGTSTVIQGLGKVPGTFKDPLVSLWRLDDASPRNGE